MWVEAFVLFLFGSVIGSFLNVVIYRLPREESIAYPPSHCPNCGHRLGPLDLVPIFSFLFLRGKCRYCGKPISWQYPFVEALTASLFALGTLLPPSQLIFYLVFICFSVPISVIDWKTMLIPEQLLIPLIMLLAIGHIFTKEWFILAGGLILFTIHAIIHLIVPEAFGLGDVLFAAAVGLMFHPLLIGIWFILTYGLGTVVGLILIAIKKTGRKTPIPFAPIMFAGTLMIIFFGSTIFNWYQSLFF
ncbi:prepilin peptidase [Coprothermobacter platensis]|uniref:prepilin peptidase n=1 Tax=Coprothermobacter platensis TaxID=108819 RepID=UPI00036A7B6A|nr:A24 family peptidase [Coprothermobacter platensis]